MSFYLFGYARSTKEAIILKCDKTNLGWATHLVHGRTPGFGNEYISNETRHDLDKWFKIDFRREPGVTDEINVARAWIMSLDAKGA